jgi:septal ring factor EnvC (AmiA/AmiB activator)
MLLAMIRMSFTPAEFQQLVDYYGFACPVTPEQLKVYLLSLKRRTTSQVSTAAVTAAGDGCAIAGTEADAGAKTSTLPDLTNRETILQELMKAETELASITQKYRESYEKATLLERARGAILEENALLKSELRRLSWENEQLRKGITDPQAPPEIETLDTQEIIKGWGDTRHRHPKTKSLWDRITGK